MTVREGQRVGGLTLLIASLAVYGWILFLDRHRQPEPPLLWGDQGPGKIAIEVAAGRGADGIYFLPEATIVAELSKITGLDAAMVRGAFVKAGISSDSTVSVSTEKGALKITELSAVKRLALGLPIDINRATEEDLLRVPGVGEKTAARILQLRQEKGRFDALADLTRIPGIKDKKLRQLEKYLTVGNSDQ